MKVRQVIKLIEEDSWYLARTRGSHRQFKHPTKSGLVTIAGKPSDDASTWHVKQHFEASSTQRTEGRRRRRVMRYAIVIEKLESNYSAHVPDLPGCVATGATLEEIEQQIKEAIAFHLDGLREEGLPIPEPTTLCEYAEACINMELSVLALQSANIALWAIYKASGGALEKAGADVLDFLTRRFQSKLQIKGSEQKLLEAAILSEAEWDKKFQEDLERLVTQYQQIQSTSYVSQSTESGVNLNVDSNPGTVIG